MLNRGKEMKKAFMFLLLILYSGITAGLETFTTGDTLLTNCEYDNPVGCMAFIAGVSDASQEKTYEGYRYCMPDNVTLGQLVNIVTKHLNSRPKDLHLAAYTLVQYALYEAFPCQ